MKKTIALILALIALCGVVTATAEEFYKLSTVVVGWEMVGDSDLRIIDCMAEDGTIWSFYDDEAFWKVGDMAMLTMWVCTEAEEDDEVIDVEKIACLDPMEVARYMLSATK